LIVYNSYKYPIIGIDEQDGGLLSKVKALT
jgi:hypothetical protein